MERKILFGMMLISVVALFIGGGTYAYFSDTEIASDNDFTAGYMNLKVGAADPCTESITITNVKPGDNANAATWAIVNSGTIDGDLSINVSTITSNENTMYDMEAAAGDSTNSTGELQDHLTVAIWMDIGNDGWGTSDYYLEDDQTTVAYTSGTLPDAAYNTVANYASDSWTDVQTNLGNGAIGTLKIEYKLPDASDINEVQSDSCAFNMTFTLDQA